MLLPILIVIAGAATSVTAPAVAAGPAVELISVASGETQRKGAHAWPSVSADGRYVVFDATAAFVGADTNGDYDVYLRDRQQGVTRRVSVGVSGAQPNSASRQATISANGRFVVFRSSATNLVSKPVPSSVEQIYRRDLVTGTNKLVSVTAGGAASDQRNFEPAVSSDGRYVVWHTVDALVPEDRNELYDVYVRDVAAGTTRRVSGPGVPEAGVRYDYGSGGARISADGRFVVFHSEFRLTAADSDDASDVYRRGLSTSTTVLVSRGARASAEGAGSADISADGRYVAFGSGDSSLVPGDTNGEWDIFRADLSTGATRRVSVGTDGRQAVGGSAERPGISADGRYLTFLSYAANLVDGPPATEGQVYRRDMQAGITRRVSQSAAGAAANAYSHDPRISADGRVVVFSSGASNLGPVDRNQYADIFAVALG